MIVALFAVSFSSGYLNDHFYPPPFSCLRPIVTAHVQLSCSLLSYFHHYLCMCFTELNELVLLWPFAQDEMLLLNTRPESVKVLNMFYGSFMVIIVILFPF